MSDLFKHRHRFLLLGALILGLCLLAGQTPGKVNSAPADPGTTGILINDPVPGAAYDNQYYDPSVQASFKGTAGRDSFEGSANFNFPPIKAGYLEIEYKEIRCVQKGYRWPIFIEFSNGLHGKDVRNLWNYSRAESKSKKQLIMTGLCWMGRCDPPGSYTFWPGATGADNWYVFTLKWDERTVGIYTGKGDSMKLVKGLPNKLGNSPYHKGCLQPRATKGSMVPSALQIPGPLSTVKTYVFKNLVLYQER